MKSRRQAPAPDRSRCALNLVQKASPASRPQHLEESTASTWRLAHEFGNLLTGILGFAELCLPLTPSGSEAHQYLCEIHQTAQQGQEFIRKFLAPGSVLGEHHMSGSQMDEHSPSAVAPTNGHPPAAAAPDVGHATLHSTGEVRHLVLDDDPTICRLIQSGLARSDFTIDAVSDPAAMEAQLRAKPYHLVLLDYVIPGLDSLQVLGWLREYQPDAAVIVMTAYPSLDGAMHCLRARTYDYLTKPFPMEQLERTVSRCLESRGLLRLSEDAMREALGAAIRERRKGLGLTLAQMALRTGLSLGYLSQIELGKNSASIETLYRISLALGTKMADLFQTVQTAVGKPSRLPGGS